MIMIMIMIMIMSMIMIMIMIMSMITTINPYIITITIVHSITPSDNMNQSTIINQPFLTDQYITIYPIIQPSSYYH